VNISASYDAAPATMQTDARSVKRIKLFMMLNTFETGGSERQFVAITNALCAERFDVRLGCVARRGPLQKNVGDVAEFPLGASLLSFRAQRSRLALGRYLRCERIQIAHSFDFYTNLLLLPTARLAGVPVVIGSQRQLGDLLTPLKFRSQRIAFRFCDAVVCNSRAAAKRLLDQGLPERKIAIIPNGLDVETFASATPALPTAPGTVRVGMIARMNERAKNHAVLLRAAARLVPKFSKLQFVLVGDGPLRAELEALASQLGIANRVSFLGDRQDVPAILASVDVAVLPSSSESLSNSILEAMAAGLPVVATRVGGNPELVSEGGTGYLVSPNDDASLADALERLLAQPELRSSFGARARRIALERFSAGGIVRQYEQLYSDLLSRSRRNKKT
jgi:L-malate glycosyltransferase